MAVRRAAASRGRCDERLRITALRAGWRLGDDELGAHHAVLERCGAAPGAMRGAPGDRGAARRATHEQAVIRLRLAVPGCGTHGGRRRSGGQGRRLSALRLRRHRGLACRLHHAGGEFSLQRRSGGPHASRARCSGLVVINVVTARTRSGDVRQLDSAVGTTLFGVHPSSNRRRPGRGRNCSLTPSKT